jgi:hypothetical protein
LRKIELLKVDTEEAAKLRDAREKFIRRTMAQEKKKVEWEAETTKRYI